MQVIHDLGSGENLSQRSKYKMAGTHNVGLKKCSQRFVITNRSTNKSGF